MVTFLVTQHLPGGTLFSLNDIAADETGVPGGDLDLVEKINTTIISGAARLTFSED